MSSFRLQINNNDDKDNDYDVYARIETSVFVFRLYFCGFHVHFAGFPLLKRKAMPYCTASAVNFVKIIVSLKNFT